MRHGLFCAALAAALAPALLVGCRAPDRDKGENTEEKFYPATEADWEAVVACLRTNYGPPHHEPLRPGFRFWPTVERRAETNVQTKLLKVGAYLSGGKVFDASGKEMCFYRVPEWSRGRKDPPPVDFGVADLEIAVLEKRHYHVVQMYVGPGPKD